MLTVTQEGSYKREIINLCANQDWQRILSLCQSTIMRLEQSGDYLEREKDILAIERLIDIKFFAKKLEAHND